MGNATVFFLGLNTSIINPYEIKWVSGCTTKLSHESEKFKSTKSLTRCRVVQVLFRGRASLQNNKNSS